jgi:hypothetical protein
MPLTYTIINLKGYLAVAATETRFTEPFIVTKAWDSTEKAQDYPNLVGQKVTGGFADKAKDRQEWIIHLGYRQELVLVTRMESIEIERKPIKPPRRSKNHPYPWEWEGGRWRQALPRY